MVFSIKFINTPNYITEYGDNTCYGVLTIMEFQETFISPFEYWGKEDYENHWRNSLKRIIDYDKSCLITSIYEPKKCDFIIWWPMYREGNFVYIQNQILFLDQLERDFDPSVPFMFVGNRVNDDGNDDGEKVSEWLLPLSDIEIFLLAQNE